MDQGDLADHILAVQIGARVGDARGASRASLDQWALQRSPMSQLSPARPLPCGEQCLDAMTVRVQNSRNFNAKRFVNRRDKRDSEE